MGRERASKALCQDWISERNSPWPIMQMTSQEAVDLGLLSSSRRKGSYLQGSIWTLRAYLMPPMLK
jgi:hypothetical protein